MTRSAPATLNPLERQMLTALQWCESEIKMRCDPRIPSVKQALEAARRAIEFAERMEKTR